MTISASAPFGANSRFGTFRFTSAHISLQPDRPRHGSIHRWSRHGSLSSANAISVGRRPPTVRGAPRQPRHGASIALPHSGRQRGPPWVSGGPVGVELTCLPQPLGWKYYYYHRIRPPGAVGRWIGMERCTSCTRYYQPHPLPTWSTGGSLRFLSSCQAQDPPPVSGFLVGAFAVQRSVSAVL